MCGPDTFSNLPDDKKKKRRGEKKASLLKRKQNMKRNRFVLASLVLTEVWVIELITLLCICVSLRPYLSVMRHTQRATGDCRVKANQRSVHVIVDPQICVFVQFLLFSFLPLSFLTCVLSDKPCSGVCPRTVCKLVFSCVFFYQTYITPRCHKYS